MAGVVSASNPFTLPLEDVTLLANEHVERLTQMVSQELARYPEPIASDLPDLFVFERVAVAGRPVRARYLADNHVVVLTPRHDLRGNVHRAVALALFARHGEAASQLMTALQEVGEPGRLYSHGLNVQGHAAALVGAVVSGRRALGEACRHDALLDRAVRASCDFLRAAGFPDDALRALPQPPPYAFLSTIAAVDGTLTMKPGDVELRLAPPEPGEFPDHEFDPLPEPELLIARRELARAVWVLPEAVLGDSVRLIHVVRDVRSSDGCDIVGFATAPSGGKATVILEHQRGRRTLYHELGHALHFRHGDRFPEVAWRALVPQHEGYMGGSRAFIESGMSFEDFDPELLRRGFITGYSSSEFHEDVAEYMEALLVGRPQLWSAMADAPLVAQKVELLIAFLHDVDPVFTRDHFERVCTERPAQEAAWGHR